MPAPTAPVSVYVDGKILWTIYDPVKRQHSIECDLCGVIVAANKSGHANRLFDHRRSKQCDMRRYMLLRSPDVDPALLARLQHVVPAVEPEHIANRCPGAPCEWDHGSMWDSYSFHKHKHNLGWIPSGFDSDDNIVYIRSDKCARVPLDSGHACYACQLVINSKAFLEVVGQAQGELDPNMPAHLRSYAHLLESYRILAADRRRVRSQVQALRRSLRAARRKLEDYQRLMVALSQRDVPRLRWLLVAAFKRGASPARLLNLVRVAAASPSTQIDLLDQQQGLAVVRPCSLTTESEKELQQRPAEKKKK